MVHSDDAQYSLDGQKTHKTLVIKQACKSHQAYDSQIGFPIAGCLVEAEQSHWKQQKKSKIIFIC